MRINLKAEGRNQELVLEYLEKNASDVLAEKINAGTKTLNDCWKFITAEAKKKAKNGCACIEDVTVYGWAIHFFEEDEIGKKEEKSKDYVNTGEKIKTRDGERAVRVPAKPKPEQKTEPLKKELTGQISLFELAGGNA